MENYVGDLVIVGSSAGGVGALLTLVSTLDKDFPAPVVLAQHLDPQRPSHLGGILQRRSNLPIVVVSEEPPTLLEPGKIYVVPSNRHVTIVDGHLHLEGTREDRPKPSVDMLLSSAAAVMMMPFEPGDSELVAISVVDATEQVQLKRRLEALQREQAQLVSELTTANKRFAETNKELQDANEELQAANEELMLTQEELQATTSGYQTSFLISNSTHKQSARGSIDWRSTVVLADTQLLPYSAKLAQRP